MISRNALSGLVVAFVTIGNFIAFQNCGRTSSASNTTTNAGEIALNSKAISEEGELMQIEGDPYSMYEDYADGSYKLRHFVRDKDGKEYELKSNRQQPYRSDKIKIKGRALKKSPESSALPEINVYEEELGPVAYNNVATNNPFPHPDSADAYSMGEQKTLLILVNFSDNPSQPITLLQGQDWLAKLDAFIREGSFNNTWISGVVVDWVTIPLSTTVCDPYNLGNQALNQARLKGYDFTLYDRHIFASPKHACSYTGMAQVGGKQTRAYINGDWTTGTLFHEFGHNFGLGHASSLECNGDPLGLNCHTIEYGDPLDVLGESKSLTGPYNPFHRLVLGWAKTSDVIEVTSNGVYNIVPYSGSSYSGAKILRISKPNDPNNWFYVNMHQPTGMDHIMLTQTPLNASNLTSGVVIREANLYKSYILDMTPGTGNIVSDWYDPALTVGKSFQDPYSGVQITTESVSSSGATVRVEFTNQRLCRARTPTMTMPSGTTSGYAGVASYPMTFTVKSQSSLDCGTEVYTLTPQLPTDWTMSFAAQPLSGPAGGNVSSTFTITPPATAALGSYSPKLAATTAYGKTSDSYSFNYYVVSPGSPISTPTPSPTPINKAPVAVNDSVTITSKVAVTIPVLANDSDPEGRDLKITAVSRPSAGSVTINADNTVTYTPAGKFKTSDTFSYTISDGSLTSSATVTITFSGSSGGNGRNK